MLAGEHVGFGLVPDGRVAGRFDVEAVVVDQRPAEGRADGYHQRDHHGQDQDSNRCDGFGVVVVEPPGGRDRGPPSQLIVALSVPVAGDKEVTNG